MGSLTDALTSLQVDTMLSYLVAFGVPALDAVLPILPSETVIIALGVATAGSTDPRIAVLILAAAAGAFAGDNLSYLIGRRFGPPAERWLFSTSRGHAARQWAERSLARYGVPLIIACRFIPGGRTAVTVACGLTGYSRRKFAAGTGAAAVIWVLYAFWLGRLGGRVFEDLPWAGFALATGIALAVTALVEAGRRLAQRAGRQAEADHRGHGEPDGGPEPGQPVAQLQQHSERPSSSRGTSTASPCRTDRFCTPAGDADLVSQKTGRSRRKILMIGSESPFANPASAGAWSPVHAAWNTVAQFEDYDSAQRAVDRLSDDGFPVEKLDVVGSDLRLVERVTGRLTKVRAAGTGAVTGLWLGLLFGLLIGLFATGNSFLAVLATGALLGAAWGALFGFAAHAATRGMRDFSSVRTIAASRYDLIARGGTADQARRMLSDAGLLPAEPVPA